MHEEAGKMLLRIQVNYIGITANHTIAPFKLQLVTAEIGCWLRS